MDSNNGYDVKVGFYPDIFGVDTSEFSFISGIRLREMWVTRKSIEYLNANGFDAFLLDPVLEASQKAIYLAEAESMYPFEGDYKVRFLNPDGSPVDVVGEDATFLGDYPPAYCTRPLTLLDCKLYSQAGAIPVDFTASEAEACAALNSGDPLDVPSRIGMQTPAFVISNDAYTETGTDCSTVPDGWYICNYIVSYFVLQVSGGKIGALPDCSIYL